MPNQSTTLPTTASSPPQSIAALLPAEIVDCILSHLDFVGSKHRETGEWIERDSNLSNMSVVAAGWRDPARRLLFRDRSIESWAGLTSEVAEWAGRDVKNMTLNIRASNESDEPDEEKAEEAASATFKLFKNLPNLESLHLFSIPFDDFAAADWQSFRTTALFPRLSDLWTLQTPFPQSVVSDLVATSPQLSQFTVAIHHRADPIALEGEQINFGGKLRVLNVSELGFMIMLDSSRVLTSSFGGLTELSIHNTHQGSTRGSVDFFDVVGPTLEKLDISHSSVDYIAVSSASLLRLSRLSVCYCPFDSSTLLLNLPPSLSFLRLSDDNDLQAVLPRWHAKPWLVPTTLKHLQVDHITKRSSLGMLPKLDKFSTNSDVLQMLQELVVGAAPFAILEVSLYHEQEVAAECRRLEVEYRISAKEH